MAQRYNFEMHDFLACCGSSKFAVEMAKVGPFSSLSQAVEMSRSIWWNKVDIPGWLEAFAAHPRIGDVEALKNDTSTAEWSKGEQSVALKSASDSTMQELAEWNRQYAAKFGFTFLICASGKSISEITASLKARFSSRPIDELQVAAGEQQKITEIRLGKLFSEQRDVPVAAPNFAPLPRSDFKSLSDSTAERRVGQIGEHFKNIEKTVEPSTKLVRSQPSVVRPPITTHVLDVSHGRPGTGIDVVLEFWKGFSKGKDSEWWEIIGSSITDSDGRSGPLMQPSNTVSAGRYKLTFNIQKYFSKLSSRSDTREVSEDFYPYISVVFEIKPSQVFEHFHIPILLSPFSYTTYRGS